MDDIATLALKIKSDDALRSLDMVGKKTAGLGDIAKQTATALASLYVGSKIVGFGKDFLMAASDMQEAGGKMEAVFKSQVDTAGKYISSLVDGFNFSRKQATDSLSTMADIFQKTGLDIRTSMQYAFDLNKQAADIDAFSNVVGGVEKVTHALTSAMLGETEEAKSLGVVILDTHVKAQMAKNAMEGLTFATEEAAKAHARFQLIMRNSANATGQVAREGDNFGNQLRKLKAEIGDVKTSFGTALVGPATVVVRSLKSVANALNSMSPAAKGAVVAAGVLGAAVVTIGVPIAKLVVGFKAYRAIQAQTAVATNANAASVKKMTFAEFQLAEAEKIAAISVASSTAAVARETVAVNANTAAKRRNNAVTGRGSSSGNAAHKVETSLKNRIFDRYGGLSKRDRKFARKSGTEQARELAMRQSARARNRNTQISRALGLSSRETKASFARRAAERALLPAVGPKTAAANRVRRLAGLKEVAMKSLTFSKQFMRLGSVIGRIAGPIGAAIGALEAFRHAPKWIESFVHEAWPAIQGFFSELPGKIGGWLSSAWSGTTEWLGEAALGVGQTFKRLAGFETEASKEYELNAKIEEAAKRREKLLAFKMKNEEFERQIDEATQSRKLANKAAFVGYLGERAPETMKLASAQASFAQTDLDMGTRKAELAKIKVDMAKNTAWGLAHPETMDMLNTENEALTERTTTLNSELETLGKTWVEQKKAVDDLTQSVTEAADQIRESQAKFKLHLAQNTEAESGYQRERKLGTAKSDIGRGLVLNEEKAYRETKIKEADTAQQQALKLNDEIEKKSVDLYDPQKNTALAEMKKILDSGDVSKGSQDKFKSLYESVSGKYNSTRASDYTLEDMQKFYGGLQTQRESLEKDVGQLMKSRDEAQTVADTKLSHVQGRDQAKDQLANIEKGKAEKAFSMKTPEQQIKSVLGDIEGLDSSTNEYKTKEKRAKELEGEIADLGKKKTSGTITPEEEKALKDKNFEKSTLDNWLTKNAGDYAKTQDERAGKSEQLDALLKPIAEKNFEEINAARKNSGKPIGPQAAMEAGSSAAFQIQNKVYNQYQKNMEQNTKNIADYLKSIRDQLLEPAQESVAVEVE